MPLAPGTSIGPFKILSTLGAGGMGEVYRAKDGRLKREVALKVLPEAYANDRERLARITREAEVLALLNHPNIATIYGVEEGALVMELVEGAPPQGPMPFDDAWKIAGQIADALEYAHEKGIVHRDLKPANVMVTPDGMVKLLDFGLAKAFTEPGTQSGGPEQSPTLTMGATQLGVILGTAAYMAPEQAKGKTVDKRADIWAFGVVLYELLTGRRLFKGEDIADTLAQVLTREPDLSQAPPQARKLLRRCLERDPKKRLRDIGEARYCIEESAVSPAVRGGRSRLPWAMAALAGALALAAGAYWLRPVQKRHVIRSFILAPEQSIFHCQGEEGGAAVLSPDGKWLAFTAASADGKVLLWARPLDSDTSQPLIGTEGASFPFWSRNSHSLGFFAGGKLKKIEATGGTVYVVADAPVSRGGAWNQDDIIVFAPTYTSAIVRVASAGGAVTPVTRLDEKQRELSHRWPSFLPDGNHFLYTSRDQGIFVAPLDGSEAPRRLLPDSSNALYSAGFLLYSHANILLARPFDASRRKFTGAAVTVAQSMVSEVSSNRACFSASDEGLLAYHAGLSESQLVWLDRSGKPVGTLGAPAQIRGVELAPDGKRAAVMINAAVGGMSVWIYELERGIRTRLASSNSPYTGVSWSPDGKRVALGGQSNGGYEIQSREVGGSGNEEVLFRSSFEFLLYSWTPNGALILSTRSPKTGWDIGYLPAGEKGLARVPIPVLTGDPNETGGYLSRDGRWILYTSDESASGSLDAYVAAFPGGGHRRQVSTTGADVVRWGANDREIFFTSRTKMMAAAVHAAGDTIEIGTPRRLFETRVDCSAIDVSCFDASPDGNRFLVIEPTGASPPVALIQNWTAGLNK